MITGISTACLYPGKTEEALDALLALGFKTFELFLNTESETAPPYLSELRRRICAAGGCLYSVHLFTAAYEAMMFFTGYERRFEDSVAQYRRYFSAAAGAGARVVVFHGDREGSSFPMEACCDRYYILSQAAKREGVILAQENVSHCRSGHIQTIRQMRAYLGKDIRFVFDVKQAVRAGEDPFEMLSAMGSDIVNVHVSDNTPSHSCLLPGAGNMDFARLLKALRRFGYDGPLITEVYRSDFGAEEELRASRSFMEALVRQVAG